MSEAMKLRASAIVGEILAATRDLPYHACGAQIFTDEARERSHRPILELLNAIDGMLATSAPLYPSHPEVHEEACMLARKALYGKGGSDE